MFLRLLLVGAIGIASVGALADDEGRAAWRYIQCNEDAARELATRDTKDPAPYREVRALEAMARCKTKEEALTAFYPTGKLQELRSWVQKFSEKWIECIQVEQRDCGPSAFSRAYWAYRHCNVDAAREVVGRAITERRSATVDVLASKAMARCKPEEDALKASYSGERPHELRLLMQKVSEWAINTEKRFQQDGIRCAGAEWSLCGMKPIPAWEGVRP